MNIGGTHRGFTLVELMIVIAIASVLLVLAIPSFKTARDNAARREVATSLYSAFQRAHSEALVRNAPVSVCAQDAAVTTPSCATSAGNFANGWVVYLDSAGAVGANIYQVHGPVRTPIQVSNTPASSLTFNSNGRVSNSANVLVNLPGSTTQNRCLRVQRSGRVAIELDPVTC